MHRGIRRGSEQKSRHNLCCEVLWAHPIKSSRQVGFGPAELSGGEEGRTESSLAGGSYFLMTFTSANEQ